MKNAYEWKSEYSPSGKCIKREWAIGPIAIWAMVVIIVALFGKPADIKDLVRFVNPSLGFTQLGK